MNDNRKRQKGMALLFVMVSIIVILGALALIMIQVQGAKRESDHAYAMIAAEEAAMAGIDMAAQTLWSDYIVSNGNTTGNWASYRFYLNNVLEIPKNEDLNFNGVQDPEETGDGDGVFDTYPPGYDQRGWAMLDEPLPFTDPDTGMVVSTLDSVHIARYDQISRSVLTVTSTGSSMGKTRTAIQIVHVGGTPTPHTQFAILANNISCILCHAEFLSLPLQNNTDPSLYGSFDRIKIAALESLLVRKTEAASNVAGTVYTRGQVYDERNRLYTPEGLAGSTFKAYHFSNENGKITQDASGNMTNVGLLNAALNERGELNQFANLYMNYPEDPLLQTDGLVPGTFPAPFPDENGDRYVNDDEFERIVQTANGRIAFEYGPEAPPGGAIMAGVAYGVPKGSVYTGTGLPTASNAALDSLSSTGSYEGNLFLVGTDDDPIIIDRTVAVDGDVVIKGPIKGYGQLLARGNVYIVGDVTYKDAPGVFGRDEDGNENAFALVAGGSIMMGDYLTVRGVNHSARENEQYPRWQEYSIHMREAHRQNNVTINGVTETLRWGYFDEWSVDSGQIVPGRRGQQFSFTTSELKLFNKMELQKALADPDYVPRFYGLRESQPNNIYIYDASDEHAVRYTAPGVKLLSDYLIEKGLPLDILDRAAFHYCSPAGNWISENTLRNIWFEDELSRPSTGRPFRFDGLLYSNNSIWAIVRSKTRHKSNTNGSMDIRGGVIAADLGVFVPGNGSTVGLRLYYDPRVERFLEIRDTSRVSFERAAFYFKRDAA